MKGSEDAINLYDTNIASPICFTFYVIQTSFIITSTSLNRKNWKLLETPLHDVCLTRIIAGQVFVWNNLAHWIKSIFFVLLVLASGSIFLCPLNSQSLYIKSLSKSLMRREPLRNNIDPVPF